MKHIRLIGLLFVTLLISPAFAQVSPLMEARNALLTDSTDKFLSLLKSGNIDVNEGIKGTPQEWTLLHVACWKVNVKAVSAILEAGYKDINNSKNKVSTTPLGAIRCQTPDDMMKSMIDGYELKVKQMEANPELRKALAPYLVKPSYQVSDYGDPIEVAKLLLDKGASINAIDMSNGTILLNAVYAGNPGLVKFLIASKADIEQRHGNKVTSKQFPTPLHAAVMKDHAAVIKVLLDGGADRKAELKEYIVDAKTMKNVYGIDPVLGIDAYVKYLKVTNTPYSLAKVFQRENALKALEEAGIKE